MEDKLLIPTTYSGSLAIARFLGVSDCNITRPTTNRNFRVDRLLAAEVEVQI
jgi:hypothetical protein